jgi:hypothetical protein
MITPKITNLKLAKQLIGIKLPTYKNGHGGRELENILERAGLSINRGHGADLLKFRLEVKSRALGATSPQTIADMDFDDIINNDYRNSHVYEKFQQQFRVYTDDDVIVSAEIYDFSGEHIQNLIEEAYNHAKQQLINNPSLTYTEYTGFYGYFEKCTGHKLYSFRMTSADMTTIENMSKSNYTNIFEEV